MSIARTLSSLQTDDCGDSLSELRLRHAWGLLKRFHELLKEYCDSMCLEFRPNPASCAEWSGYMKDLQWALAFVFEEFDVIDCSTTHDQSLTSLRDLMVACDDRIMKAIRCLELDNPDSSASKITNAREELEALLFTLNELDTASMTTQISMDSLSVSLDDEGDALNKYESSFYAWVQYLDGEIQRSAVLNRLGFAWSVDEGEQPDDLDFDCIISRCVYLRAVLFAYVSPLEWVGGTRLHALLKIQERVRREKLYAPTPHRYNVSSRLQEIRKSQLLTGRLYQ